MKKPKDYEKIMEALGFWPYEDREHEGEWYYERDNVGNTPEEIRFTVRKNPSLKRLVKLIYLAGYKAAREDMKADLDVMFRDLGTLE